MVNPLFTLLYTLPSFFVSNHLILVVERLTRNVEDIVLVVEHLTRVVQDKILVVEHLTHNVEGLTRVVEHLTKNEFYVLVFIT